VLQALLEQSGLHDVRVMRRVLPVSFDGGSEQLGSTLAASGIAADIAALSPEQHHALLDAVARRLGDGPVDSELASHIALAHR
jgi:hypothetical protein